MAWDLIISPKRNLGDREESIAGGGDFGALKRGANGEQGAGADGAAVFDRFSKALADGGAARGLGFGRRIFARFGNGVERRAAGVDGASACGLGAGVGGLGRRRIGIGCCARRVGRRGCGGRRGHRIGGYRCGRSGGGKGNGLRFGIFVFAAGECQDGEGQ